MSRLGRSRGNRYGAAVAGDLRQCGDACQSAHKTVPRFECEQLPGSTQPLDIDRAVTCIDYLMVFFDPLDRQGRCSLLACDSA